VTTNRPLVRRIAAFAGAVLFAACGPTIAEMSAAATITSTDGVAHHGGDQYTRAEAVRASAAHDMPCAPTEIRLPLNRYGGLGAGPYEVTGCGRHFVYTCRETPGESFSCTVELVSRETTRATDGTERADLDDLARASAAHDIPCAMGALRIVLRSESQYIVEGCAQRVTYAVGRDAFVLTARLALGATPSGGP
jgi:hypothetical protein